jgi:pimeloyl-ACP methyl ester carboxylesterase
MRRPSFPRPPYAPLIAAAVVLGSCAYLTRRLTKRALADNPPRGAFVEADGVRLHYTEHGDPRCPPLVMVHGNGAMAQELEISGLVDLAARSFHVYVFDRPGYGHSERPAGRSYSPDAQAALLVAALRQLGVQRSIVFGHSWGALVALAAVLQEPRAFRAVVLASGYYTPSLRLDTVTLGAPAIPVLGTLMRHTITPLWGRMMWPLMLRRLFRPAAVTEKFKRLYPVWMSLRPGQLKASASEAATMTAQAAKLLRRERHVSVPALIVAGEQDRLVSTAWQSMRLHERLPGSRLRIVPGAGHMVHHTSPADVMEAIYEAWHCSAPDRTAVVA